MTGAADLPDRYLAVDVGGTKMAVGVVTVDGLLVARRQAPTPAGPERGPEAARQVYAVLEELVTSFAPFDQYRSCGVGCGGPLSSDGELASPINIRSWRSFPLAEELRRTTGLRVKVDNDAKALALAEGWVGAAVGCDNYVAMVVSTGVGGGIVLDGRLLEGEAGNAGHIGHVVVEPDGFEHEGHVRGVLESEASGPAIQARTGSLPQEADTAEIHRVGRMVGRAVGSVANLLDLPLALVGGSVALGFGEPFFAAAQEEIDRICVLDYSRGTVIRPVGCGDEGPLIGAAAVARRAFD